MNKNIIVIGASAGGVDPLKTLVAGLPADLNAAVFIVLHLGASARSELHGILQKRCALPVARAEEGEPICMGRVFVARPDYHLALDHEVVRLSRGPRENRVRPSIDVLFRSAAHAHGGRTIGVVLSGGLDDGSAGLWWIKQRGGTAVVQDPREAQFSSMPESAMAHVTTDHVVSVEDMPSLLAGLVLEEATETAEPVPKELDIESRIARGDDALEAGIMELGPITPYTCPECHGVLLQLKSGGIPRFRCHTGHAYSINTLLAEVTEYVEDALWNSMRAIEESALLLRHLGRHVREEQNNGQAADLLDQKATDTLHRAEVIRRVVHDHQTVSQDNLGEVEEGAR